MVLVVDVCMCVVMFIGLIEVVCLINKMLFVCFDLDGKLILLIVEMGG